jgi:hypothetical protein
MRRLGVMSAVVAGLGMTVLGARDASACGGEFVNPDQNVDTVVSAHRMILSLSTTQTTLYDEIEFDGTASSFAWVLPIKGTATVGLSADLVFASLDSLTSTQVAPPPTNCPPPPSCDDTEFDAPAAEGAGFAADAGAAKHSGVTVTEQQQVGPYETVQLQSTDPGALNAWLTAHGYAIPAAEASVVSAYVTAGFNFLAMKLAPGEGVTAMRPVRVTTAGASPVLPLRMVGVGTGATTSITLWVIADGRWEPQNFPFFELTGADIAWDWSTSSSNYDTVRLAKEAALGGRGWQVESSLELAQYSLQSLVLDNGGNFFPEPATGTYLPVGDAGTGSDAGADADESYFYDAGSLDAALPPDGSPETANQVRQADLDTLFAGIAGPNARITRLRTDISHTALTADLQLQASSDQSEVSNIYNPGQQIGQPLCPVFNENCEQVGTAPRSEAIADAATTGGGGCSTSNTRSPMASRGAFGALLGLAGFVAMRSRRKRKSA